MGVKIDIEEEEDKEVKGNRVPDCETRIELNYNN